MNNQWSLGFPWTCLLQCRYAVSVRGDWLGQQQQVAQCVLPTKAFIQAINRPHYHTYVDLMSDDDAMAVAGTAWEIPDLGFESLRTAQYICHISFCLHPLLFCCTERQIDWTMGYCVRGNAKSWKCWNFWMDRFGYYYSGYVILYQFHLQTLHTLSHTVDHTDDTWNVSQRVIKQHQICLKIWHSGSCDIWR